MLCPGRVFGVFVCFMTNTILVGAQWGDEGKGKATDLLGNTGEVIDYVVKFNGGNNAGHTVVIGSEKYAVSIASVMLCVTSSAVASSDSDSSAPEAGTELGSRHEAQRARQGGRPIAGIP